MSYHYANGPAGYPGMPAGQMPGQMPGQGQMGGATAGQGQMQQPAAGMGAHGGVGQFANPGVPGGGFGYGYTAYTPYHYQAQQQTPFFNFSNDRFLKGVLIGAAAAYLLTNESVQRSVIKGAVKAWSLVQGGVAELKERFGDAEAELRAEQAGKENG